MSAIEDFMNDSTLKQALAVGVAATVVGFGLQKAYKATNYYPPQGVFLFATGAGAFLLYGAAKKTRPLNFLLA